MEMNRGSKSSADKDDEFIPSSSKKPKLFIREIVGIDNLDVETIEKIQDHDQPSIMGSEDKIVSIPVTELDGTVDCVHRGNLNDANILSTVEPTNGEPSTSDKLNTKVVVKFY